MKQHGTHLLGGTILWGLLSGLACAQPAPALHLEHTTSRAGLSNNRVTSIVQDRAGFMWFGTSAGLNRFDGHEFRVLGTDPRQPNQTFRNDAIWNVLTDSRGQLWATTTGDGLHRIDTQRWQSRGYRLDSVSQFQFMNVFFGMAEESVRVLWVGTRNGLLRYDTQTRLGVVYKLPAGLGEVSVFCVAFDQTGRLWVGTKAGLFWFDRASRQFRAVALPGVAGPAQPIVSALAVDTKTGQLWVGTQGEALFKLGATAQGLFRVDTRPVATLPAPGAAVVEGGSSPGGAEPGDGAAGPVFRAVRVGLGAASASVALNSICLTTDAIWLGTDQGLFRIHRATSQITHYRADRSRPDGLSSNTILSLCPDREGNLWIGTDNGIDKLSRASRHFAVYQLIETAFPIRNAANNMSGVLEDSTGTVWLGSPISGLYRVPPGQTTPVSVPAALLSRRIRTLYHDRQGRLWIGTDEGLHQLNPRTGQVVGYVCRLPVQYIAQEPAGGRLWIAGEGGPAAFDPKTGQFAYLPDSLQNAMWYATALCLTQTGQLWVGHLGGGVHQYDLRSGALRQFLPRAKKNEPTITPGLSDLNVIALHEDRRGQLWIGTQRGGITLYNTKTKTLRWLTTAQGLPSQYVSGIVGDRHGTVWVSTDKGLARYNTRTGTFRAYGDGDGLPLTQFTENSVGAGRSRLLFGGPDGCLAFDPDKLSPPRPVPPVFVTGLTVNGQNRPIPGDWIELTYRENGLAFRFAALTYQPPGNDQYQYRLVGQDDGWLDARQQSTAHYANLRPGTYQFLVRGANSDGIWNPRPAQLTVVILPPWWATGQAFGLYALLMAGLIWLIIRFYTARLRLQQQADFQQRQTEQLRVLDGIKTRFFTNITHEFRTPLTLILSPIEALRHELGAVSPHAGRLLLVSRYARQLLGLVNQLLDLAKLDAALMPVEVSPNHLGRFTERLVSGFSESARQQGISLTVQTTGAGNYWFDADKLDRILTNLIANALKFTPLGGSVTVTVRASGSETVTIQVLDTGIGISTEALPRIFDRFYQAPETDNEINSARKPATSLTTESVTEPVIGPVAGAGINPGGATSTGIGLSLVKELTELQGGQISVTSRPAHTLSGGSYQAGETVFTLTLPYRPATEPAVADAAGTEPDNFLPTTDFYPNPDAGMVARLPVSAPATALPETGNLPDSAEKPVVLVVEDNPDLRAFIVSLLPDSYQILEADNGLTGLQTATEHLPDLVVSDVMMPGMDGLTLCQTLKTDALTNHIPVLLLTAKASVESRMAGLTGGADDYISKPFEPRELQLRIQNRLTQQQRQRDRIRQQLLALQPASSASPAAPRPTDLAEDPFWQQFTHELDSLMSNPTLDVDILAGRVNMSRRTLHRKLTTLTGMAPNEIIRTYRLRRAAERIGQGRSIADIAYETGFDSPAYFSKCFKEQYGVSPSVYQA